MSQNSKLSEALAATLLRFKEIDRDTIEALSKRAATLEHQVTQNTADIDRETTLRSMLQDTKDQLADWQKAEQAISSSYLKIRGILGANSSAWMEPNPAEPQIQRLYEYTENVAEQLVKSHSQLQWALRDLLAHTRDLNDSSYDGWSYEKQSDALKNAITTADALVGEQATEQYPIVDEPLNRRIQELEVRLAKAEKVKGQVFLAEAFIRPGSIMQIKDGDGVVCAHMGNLQNPTTADQPIKWSENALRKLVADIVAKPSETPAGPVCAPGTGLACAGLNVTVHVSPTVKGDEAMARKVRDSIFEEMKHGGAIHTAFYGK